jgi:hypothetical protein
MCPGIHIHHRTYHNQTELPAPFLCSNVFSYIIVANQQTQKNFKAIQLEITKVNKNSRIQPVHLHAFVLQFSS